MSETLVQKVEILLYESRLCEPISESDGLINEPSDLLFKPNVSGKI